VPGLPQLAGSRGLRRAAVGGILVMTTTSTTTTRTTTMTMAAALNAALRDALETDPDVLLIGEDIGTLGGVFRITDGLQDRFGADRVIDSPLAESGILGTSVGMAYR